MYAFFDLFQANDYLVNALVEEDRLKREGSIESSDVLPVAGLEQYVYGSSMERKTVCVPLEVYSITASPFLLIQQRSMCVRGRTKCFVKNLVDMLSLWGIEQVVVLSGAAWTESFEECFPQHRQFTVCSELETRSMFVSKFPNLDALFIAVPCFMSTSSELRDMKGSPLLRHILPAFSARQLAYLVVGKFSSDGNNAPDGIELARTISKALGLLQTETHDNYPASWRKLFGPELHFSRDSSRIYM